MFLFYMAKLTLNSFIHNLLKTLLIVENKFSETFENFISYIQNYFYTIITAHYQNKLALCFHFSLHGFQQGYQQPFACENIKCHGFQQVVNKLTIHLYFNHLCLNNLLITLFAYTNNLICKKKSKILLYILHRP